jgi:ABC-type nickel/cobalt efflux system permease component RcnA
MAAGSLGIVITIIVDNLRRNAPLTMVIITAAGLLICLGLLLGASWTRQALQADYRHRAEQRRQLTEEWQALRTARHHNHCPHCTSPLSPHDPDPEPTTIDQTPYDDDWQQYVK